MRNKLASYVGEFIHARGWIASWTDFKVDGVRSVIVANPTLTKPNRDCRFDEQEIISKESHLNLFIKHDDLLLYDTTFEIHQPINFSGLIENYSRSDGTHDYGVYPTKQSNIHFEIKNLLVSSLFNRLQISETSIDYLRDYAIPRFDEILKELDACGDQLPTFRHTYGEYKDLLKLEFIEACDYINTIDRVKSSREFRRKCKKKNESLDVIKGL